MSGGGGRDAERERGAAEEDAPVAARLRPTLFVGLGGTGKEVLLRLRRRILQHDWDGRRVDDLARFPAARFLYFDTDTTDAIESDRSRRGDAFAAAVRFRENERLQKRVDIRRTMTEIDNLPLIGDWLPEADLSSINTEKGAGQVRAISRLLFFDQFAILQRRVREAGDALLNSVSNQHELERLNLEIDPELRIVVVCSAAGGTGSGAFIDLGLMARSLRNPRPAQVDLVLLLPGGFKGNNYQRVNANSFAALMELEHAMRPGSEPPYVERWTEREGPVRGIAPYDDVYLVDSRNVLMAGTDQVEQVFDMLADILFEDLGSSEFAARKRSISPNQQQFKMVNYSPPLSPRVGERSLSWSCAFSSFGQAIVDTKAQVAVDTAVARAAKAMLKGYFNVALEESGRLPTVEERDRFLAEEFLLRTVSFEEALDGLDDRGSINEPALLGALLRNENGESVAGELALLVQRRFESELFGGAELANLPILVLREFEQRRDDVLGTMQHNAPVGPAGAAVVANRQRLARERRGNGEGGIRDTLFRILDNRSRGGLDYAIRLVEDSKPEMDAAVAELDAVERRYAARAEQTRMRFEGSLENLKEAVAGRFLLGPDRRAAMRYLGHLRTEIIYLLTMLLRRQAAIEARTFLREMSAELGTRRGVDADGRILWDGAVAELVAGRRLVEQCLGGFDAEIALLQEAVSREEAGTYLVLPDADAEADTLLRTEPAEIERWAAEIFDGGGGSRALFPVLEDEGERA
ncbi:MAG: hypothetical protein INR65_17060, partial [Gluconacetobacter diazotrophicus]|nr:hypothetical protein [Gluconacetobacter diazotrophicus]